MPGQDGLETLRQLRRDVPETAVVMMSGHGSLRLAVKAMQLGAVDYLEKPLTADRVLKTVQRAVVQAQLAAPKGHLQTPASRVNHAAWTNGTASAVSSSCSQVLPDTLRQRTLACSVVLQGQGLQSGTKTGIILSPLPPGEGVQFRDMMTRTLGGGRQVGQLDAI